MTNNFSKNIRNFVIIAHVDHGKSTLADRFLEITNTIPMRSMRPQFLDQLELERERGITIKMAPVRMKYALDGVDYILNLIDTPGHSDFGYEVSRALLAVEGAILLVDATQGIQAQTLANFEAARRANLRIIGAVNKIDIANENQIAEAVNDLALLLGTAAESIFKVSGKLGDGVSELLKAVIRQVPSPSSVASSKDSPPTSRALIFDSSYDEHKGILAFVRVFEGEFGLRDKDEAPYQLLAKEVIFKPKDVGYFSPRFVSATKLSAGEIGYIATGLKDPDQLKIGDTISELGRTEALHGFQEPKPVIFASFYPEESGEYESLKNALGRLRLNDSAIQFVPDYSEVLGRGFKVGFLGQLHFEIVAERLVEEFNMATVHSFPSVAYLIKMNAASDWLEISNPKDFPNDFIEAREPVIKIEILIPTNYLGAVLQLAQSFRFREMETKNLGNRITVSARMPLSDLIRDFHDQLKSATQGFGSLSYELAGYEKAEVRKMEILVAEHVVPGLTRVVAKEDVESEARLMVERLKKLLPKEQFAQAVQASVDGRIVARETIPALRKDVTGYLYGGDRSRKMKLWKKQQRGKQKLKAMAEKSQLKIPASVFKELLKK